MIRIVTATRLSADDFREKSWLWKSLRERHQDDVLVTFKNTRGLPEIYNDALAQIEDEAFVVFAHDDLFISDLHFAERLERALERFDVVGLAGNARRVPGQAQWISADGKVRDNEYLRGAVAHPCGDVVDISTYGVSPDEVKLLDGVLLAARVGVLRKAGVAFDPRFRFHFYDLDFCRSCEQAGLKMGVWPIAVVHQSGGTYGSSLWSAEKDVYLKKWGD